MADYSLLQNPTHSGEAFKELCLGPMEMSASSLAKRIDEARTRIERLMKTQTLYNTRYGLCAWVRHLV